MLELIYRKNLIINEKGHGGYTSCSFKAPDIFVKYINNDTWQKYNVYEREKYLAGILGKFDWFPKLIYSDDNLKYFIYKNVGIPLNKDNKPKDLKLQFDKILDDLKSVNVQHNDIKIGELLINESGKVFLCDFGWGSVNNDLGCGVENIWSGHNKQKPGGWLDDADSLKRLDLI